LHIIDIKDNRTARFPFLTSWLSLSRYHLGLDRRVLHGGSPVSTRLLFGHQYSWARYSYWFVSLKGGKLWRVERRSVASHRQLPTASAFSCALVTSPTQILINIASGLLHCLHIPLTSLRLSTYCPLHHICICDHDRHGTCMNVRQTSQHYLYRYIPSPRCHSTHSVTLP
jgi:hypothetical protein